MNPNSANRPPLQPLIAVAPTPVPEYVDAVLASGGLVCEFISDANGLIWTDSNQPLALLEILKRNPELAWVQLPFAGVDNFLPVFAYSLASGLNTVFTSAKGAYREPVAEHALMLALALARALPERIRAKTWGRKFAASLFDSNVVIVGGGGIASELVRLLAPFRPAITVFRKHPEPAEGVSRTLPIVDLNDALPAADFVFVAAALTPETQGLFNSKTFKAMKPTAYFVNVARGGLVVSEDLVDALELGLIAGAGLDVTDPEPLPDGHRMWSTPNLIITPHSADTPEMCIRLLSDRIRVNTKALSAGMSLEGEVNQKLGY